MYVSSEVITDFTRVHYLVLFFVNSVAFNIFSSRGQSWRLKKKVARGETSMFFMVIEKKSSQWQDFNVFYGD